MNKHHRDRSFPNRKRQKPSVLSLGWFGFSTYSYQFPIS